MQLCRTESAYQTVNMLLTLPSLSLLLYIWPPWSLSGLPMPCDWLSACDKVCTGCTGAGPNHCLACADGYRDEEGTCTDIDECEQADPACPGEHRECVNTKGSYKCFCSSGFEEQDGVCVQTPEPGEHPMGSCAALKLCTHRNANNQSLYRTALHNQPGDCSRVQDIV
ncbi:hypothetical protein JZ751_009049 [Albula glossodonta]|uniref:EGF-like domain-containing protein n=1 Tax=Albula glossodonta TaxID=121402 RepID=A0A8T2NXV3_9TELE|nr:hypothetical protein JZ751_009049 [Albula glossodonta]